MAEWLIERLSAAHDRSTFSSGEPSLDDFLRQYASQYDRKNMGRTFVAVAPDSARVLGYYTLSSGSVAFANLPAPVSRKLPRHPIPVAHLGRLAVDLGMRGRKLGAFLLLDALQRCLFLGDQIGIFAVEVNALSEAARQFYMKYGFTPLADDASHLYLRLETVTLLFAAKEPPSPPDTQAKRKEP